MLWCNKSIYMYQYFVLSIFHSTLITLIELQCVAMLITALLQKQDFKVIELIPQEQPKSMFPQKLNIKRQDNSLLVIKILSNLDDKFLSIPLDITRVSHVDVMAITFNLEKAYQLQILDSDALQSSQRLFDNSVNHFTYSTKFCLQTMELQSQLLPI